MPRRVRDTTTGTVFIDEDTGLEFEVPREYASKLEGAFAPPPAIVFPGVPRPEAPPEIQDQEMVFAPAEGGVQYQQPHAVGVDPPQPLDPFTTQQAGGPVLGPAAPEPTQLLPPGGIAVPGEEQGAPLPSSAPLTAEDSSRSQQIAEADLARIESEKANPELALFNKQQDLAERRLLLDQQKETKVEEARLAADEAAAKKEVERLASVEQEYQAIKARGDELSKQETGISIPHRFAAGIAGAIGGLLAAQGNPAGAMILNQISQGVDRALNTQLKAREQQMGLNRQAGIDLSYQSERERKALVAQAEHEKSRQIGQVVTSINNQYRNLSSEEQKNRRDILTSQLLAGQADKEAKAKALLDQKSQEEQRYKDKQALEYAKIRDKKGRPLYGATGTPLGGGPSVGGGGGGVGKSSRKSELKAGKPQLVREDGTVDYARIMDPSYDLPPGATRNKLGYPVLADGTVLDPAGVVYYPDAKGELVAVGHAKIGAASDSAGVYAKISEISSANAELNSKVQRFENLLKVHEGEIGKVQNWEKLPAYFATGPGAELQGAYADIFNQILYDQSGKAVTKWEEFRQKQALPFADVMKPDRMKAMLSSLNNIVDDNAKQIAQVAHNPGVYKEIKKLRKESKESLKPAEKGLPNLSDLSMGLRESTDPKEISKYANQGRAINAANPKLGKQLLPAIEKALENIRSLSNPEYGQSSPGEEYFPFMLDELTKLRDEITNPPKPPEKPGLFRQALETAAKIGGVGNF